MARQGVVIYTWGSVSGIDCEQQLLGIKPSGVDYDRMPSDDMVVVDLFTETFIEGKWKPNSDTATHLEFTKDIHQ